MNAAPVAVVSYQLWRELGGDPALVGRQLRLGGEARTIVGVMPRGFWFPTPSTKLWTAVPFHRENEDGNWTLVGRVAPGARLDNMSAPLDAIASELGKRFKYPPQWDKTRAPALTPVRDFIVGDVRPGLLATLAAMALILVMACVNVSALMLGQVSGRATELAVRTALGAGRQRLMQQLVFEALLLGILSSLVGAALASVAFKLLLELLPLGTLADSATLDWTVFAAATFFALIAAVVVAVVPSVALWRGNLQGTMGTGRTGGISGRGGRIEGALVIAQIAVAVLLASGAGLLLRSVAKLRSIDPGVRVDNVAVVDVTIPSQLTTEQRQRAVLDILPALQAIPNVRAAAAAEKIPLRGSGDNWGMRIRGKPELRGMVTAVRIITDDYFKAMAIPLRRGRTFEPADRQSKERLVVINEALAQKYFPGEDPVGRYLQTFDPNGERIVGVVGNVAEARLTDPPAPARYMLYEHVPAMLPATTFVLAGSSAADVPRLLQTAKSVIQRDGRSMAVERTAAMASIFDDAVGAPGRVATLVSVLAALALVLGALGVYGMISHYVTRRLREYGIKLALGMAPERVITQVLGRGAAARRDRQRRRHRRGVRADASAHRAALRSRRDRSADARRRRGDALHRRIAGRIRPGATGEPHESGGRAATAVSRRQQT